MMTTLHTVPIEDRGQLRRAFAHFFSFAYWSFAKAGQFTVARWISPARKTLLEAVRLTIPRN
jgi:hypothetical protein